MNYILISTFEYLHRLTTRTSILPLPEPQAKSRESFCVNLLKMSPAVNALYVRSYFTQLSKDSIRIVKNLTKKLRRMIKRADWIDSAVKIYYMEQLNKLFIQIGYPQDLLSDLDISSYYKFLTEQQNETDSFVMVVLKMNQWKVDKQFRQLASKSIRKKGIRYFDVLNPNIFYDIDHNAVCK